VPVTPTSAPSRVEPSIDAVFVDTTGVRRVRARAVMGVTAAVCFGFLGLVVLGLGGTGPLSGNVVIAPLHEVLTTIGGGSTTPAPSSPAGSPLTPAPATSAAAGSGSGASRSAPASSGASAAPSAPAGPAAPTTAPARPRPVITPSVSPTAGPTPSDSVSPSKPGQGASHRASAKPTHTPGPKKS
jgi:hypothetical protein